MNKIPFDVRLVFTAWILLCW